MAVITSLPEEVLSVIFNKLNDPNSLAKCRLVCKAWCGPAERAMLGSTVTITPNAAKMRSLYAVLKKNPEKAYLIKHLDLDTIYDRVDLLKIVLAPNVESLTGYAPDYGFFTTDTLADIVERSPNKLSRLKILTLSSTSGPPLRLALNCRNTIQTIRLDFADAVIDWTFLDRLNEFINLTSLELTAEMDTITDLDRILSKCPQLQKLSLAIYDWKDNLDWDQQRIERNTNLKMLSIPTGEFCPDEMLEYLLYKYPSIESIFVDALIAEYVDEEYLIQVPQLLQRIPQRKLIYSLLEDVDVRFVLKCLKSIGCKVTVEPDPGRDIRFKVDY